MDDVTAGPSRLLPGREAPDLTLPLVGGGTWRLSEQTPALLTAIFVYRGLHCPLCKGYLGRVHERLAAFAELGVEVVAVSADGAERAAQAKVDWGLVDVPVAYGLAIDEARHWGLYVSRRIKDGEPDVFVEPGLFLIKPDRTLYAAQVGTMPWLRPELDLLLRGLTAVKERGTPPQRGGE